jgi:hypothetical protein
MILLKGVILSRLMLRVRSWFRHNSVLECYGSLNSVGFGGVPSQNSNSLYRCALVYKDIETYFTCCGNVTSKLVWPNQDGIVQRLTWIYRMNDRNVHSGAPGDTCESMHFVVLMADASSTNPLYVGVWKDSCRITKMNGKGQTGLVGVYRGHRWIATTVMDL